MPDILLTIGNIYTMKIENSHKHHISLTSSNEVQEICQPILSCFPFIKIFEYSRIYTDGSLMAVSNNTSFLEIFFQSKRYEKFYVPSLLPKDLHHLKIEDYIKTIPNFKIRNNFENIFKKQYDLLKIHDAFIIINRNNDCLEWIACHFHANLNHYGYKIFNHIDILEQFILYFKFKAGKIIAKADSSRIIKPWRNPDQDPKGLDTLDLSTDNFFKDTFPKKISIKINRIEIILSKRELHCLQLVMLGKSNHAIAKDLFLSPRTVESHLDSLRSKIGCSNRDELIEFFLNSELANWLLLSALRHKRK
jgi:LuxR family transcriptional regulator, quorum-sensing system regulator SolR